MSDKNSTWIPYKKHGYRQKREKYAINTEIQSTQIYLIYGTIANTDNHRYLYDLTSTEHAHGENIQAQPYQCNRNWRRRYQHAVTKQNLKTWKESYDMDYYQDSQRTIQQRHVQYCNAHHTYLTTHATPNSQEAVWEANTTYSLYWIM